MELARVAWTVHAQAFPRRAGKPAVRKPTHARLVCLVKPIPFPCFQSSSGCIESPTSLRKNPNKTPFPNVNEGRSTINFVGELILWKNRTNTAYEASPRRPRSCLARGVIRAMDLVAVKWLFLLLLLSLLLLSSLSRCNTSGTLPWYSLAAATCASTLRVWLKMLGLKRTSLSASLASGLSSVCVDFREPLLFHGSGASCS